MNLIVLIDPVALLIILILECVCIYLFCCYFMAKVLLSVEESPPYARQGILGRTF